MKIRINPLLMCRKLGIYTDEGARKIHSSFEKIWNQINLDRLEREVFNNCITLRNLAIVQKDIPMATDYILEELKNNSKLLKPTYSIMISQLRMGKGDEAFEILSYKVPTKSGKIFTYILTKLDKINPVELVTTMNYFEETFSEERMTKSIRNTEQKSIITTALSTASIFAILMNFSVVVVFMDTLSMLGQVF